MATFPGRRYPLKISLLLMGLACSCSIPASSQPIPGPLQPGPPGSIVAVTPALQPPENVQPPRIKPPAIPERPIKVQRTLLPPGFMAVFPQFDGDGFFFIPATTQAMSPEAMKVFEDAVIPFLNAIGFQNPADRFRRFGAGYQGRKLPKANLKALVKLTCGTFQPKENKQTQQQVCKALAETENLTPEFERFRNAIERVEVEYFFVQEREVNAMEHTNILGIPKKVPLEHVGIRVERREGKAGLFVSGRVINDDVTVSNVIKIKPGAVPNTASEALAKVEGVRAVFEQALAPVELLLLPYDGSGGSENRPALKYAYRTALVADFNGVKGTFYLWLDADTGKILQLVPAMGSATAGGKAFLGDPSSLPVTEYANFNINDPSSGGQYVLQLSPVFGRIDWNGDGVYDVEVAEPSEKFDQAAFSASPTIESVACLKGGNKKFAQVDLMATISRYRGIFNNAGPRLWEFPRTERKIWINHEGTGCDAYTGHDGFRFGLCLGYSHPLCPDIGDLDLNPAHDHTVVAHELGHAFTGYQYGYPEDLNPAVKPSGDRPASWCNETTLESTAPAPCPTPTSPSDTFHDFADAWAHLLEDTNCFGGWVAKNRGGPNASKNCVAGHSELNEWPRLSDAAQDHFPEHRKATYDTLVSYTTWKMPYSDMQIAAAALWSVRQGLVSRDPIMGAVLYKTRFMRTLAMTGWLGVLNQSTIQTSSGGTIEIYTDRDIYRYLVELEVKLANRWSGSIAPGESTINKVASGFARAGIFMIPWGCLDGDASTPAGSPCESGADAVIDVEPGKDYLTRTAGPPTFHIWTGPLYTFNSSGFSSLATPSPCNTAFEVEISNGKNFAPLNTRKSTPASGVWKTVSNTSPSGCHTTWRPDQSEWDAVKGMSGETALYYRLKTKNSMGAELRESTRPANGLFGDFDPPYLIVNDSVSSDVPPAAPTNLRVL